MKYFAHIITDQHESGRPEINIFTEDGQWTTKYRLITYLWPRSESSGATLLSALDMLRGCGWTVFANIQRKGTGYYIAEVAEPA